MGISLGAPALSQLAANRLFVDGGWSLISSNPIRPTSRIASNVNLAMSTRLQCVVPSGCPNGIHGVRLVFANWYTNGGTGEWPNTNGIFVRAALQPYNGTSVNEVAGDLTIPVKFGGASQGYCEGGRTLFSDPVEFRCGPGQFFWIKSWQSSAVPAAPAVAPALTIGGGGTGFLPTGTYQFCYTIVYPGNIESLPSPLTSTGVVAANGSATVTAPAAVAGALGYRVYCTLTGATTPQYDAGSGCVPFGANWKMQTLFAVGARPSMQQVNAGDYGYYPTGGGILGGTGPGSSNTGEAYLNTYDATSEAYPAGTPNTAQQVTGPIAVLGLTPSGIARSVAKVGDSIAAVTADYGYGPPHGGFLTRAAQNQLGRAYAPYAGVACGYIDLAQGSETALTAALTSGGKRARLATLATDIVVEYGRNDLSLGGAPLVASLYSIHGRFQVANTALVEPRRVWGTTLVPLAASTDGYTTLANQTLAGASEGYRRQVNAWRLSGAGATTITGEAPYVGSATAYGPSHNFYGGGDGATTQFVAQNVALSSSLTVTVNGTTKALGTDYTLLYPATIGGTAYCSGVAFTTAPAAGAVVLFSYTSIPGFTAMFGAYSGTIDSASALEVNGSGVAGTNGGFVKVAAAPVVAARALTGVTSSSITDTALSMTQDQYRGYCVLIVTDPVTPAAVGQIGCIANNTAAGVMTLGGGFATVPSSSATYQIYDPYLMSDATHPSTAGHIAMAGVVKTALGI